MILEELLVADRPSCRERWEVTPTSLLGKLGCIEGITTEVELQEVTVVVTIAQTSEVRKLGSITRSIVHALGGISQQVVDVAEVGLIGRKDIIAFRSNGIIVPMILGKRHTCHRTHCMLTECIHIVGEVFPLIVQAVVGLCLNVVLG